MKVTVKENKASTDIEYPCLMVLKTDPEKIILFEQRDVGTRLSPCDQYDFGKSNNGWDIEQFKPFTGSITLSNGE